jgi:hypothetical protein
MKKIILFPFLLFLTILLFAQNDEIAWNNGDAPNVTITPDKDVVWVFDVPEKTEEKEEKIIEKGKLLRIPDRAYELGLFNFNLGGSNDFMTASEIFKEKININLDDLSGGFNANAYFILNPVNISYNKNDIWGFGVSAGLDLSGVIGLNGNMLTFHETGAAKSDIGASVFSEVKAHGFFTFEKIKFKVKPAVYYPILYAKPDNFKYTFKNIKNAEGVDETYFNLEFDMRVYTAFPVDRDFEITGINDLTKITDKISEISAKPGVDFSIGAEYPLSEALGLINKFEFLYFDVGVDFINIPVYPADMEDYIRMIVNIGSNEPIDFFGGMFGDSLEDLEDFEGIKIDNFYSYKIEEYGKERRKVFRPFKMLISANWHPFDKPFKEDGNGSLKIRREWLTIIPIVGFAINPLYFEPFSIEGGIKGRLNLFNFFIASLGIGYYDRLWKNSLDFALNFRIIEIDFGVSMQSPGFLKSWTGGGFGAAFGLKLGW